MSITAHLFPPAPLSATPFGFRPRRLPYRFPPYEACAAAVAPTQVTVTGWYNTASCLDKTAVTPNGWSWATAIPEYRKTVAEYMEGLRRSIRGTSDWTDDAFGTCFQPGTFRFETAGVPFIAESTLEGVTLTRVPSSREFSGTADWWQNLVDPAGSASIEFNGFLDEALGIDTAMGTCAPSQELWDSLLTGVDASLAKQSEILFSPWSTVFLPRVQVRQPRWSRDRASLRREAGVEKFHQTNSPALSVRSLHIPSWDRSLQVRA